METLIKNHKTKGNSKKRETKMEKEKEVLALFKKKGDNSLKSIKQASKILKQADQETKKKEELFSKPPPYLPPEGQFTILKGTVEVSGEMQMEGQIDLDKKQKEPDVRPKRQQHKKSEWYLPLDCYKQARIALEMMKANYEGKTGNEETLEQMRRGDKDIEAQAEAMEAKIGRKFKETEKFFEDASRMVRDRSKLLESREEVSEGEESSFDEGTWEQGREKGRLRAMAAQLPILIKGTQGQYVPWATQDLDGLVTRLPDIHEGAGKWIKMFEEETMGKLLAVGDIKALLAKTIGGAKMKEILQVSNV